MANLIYNTECTVCGKRAQNGYERRIGTEIVAMCRARIHDGHHSAGQHEFVRRNPWPKGFRPMHGIPGKCDW